MTMPDERTNEMLGRVRETYNVPSDTPREEMWQAISARMGETHATVVDLAAARRRRSRAWGPVRWAVAAAALLVLGVGVGRMSAPVADGAAVAAIAPDPTAALEFVAREHLGRTESLLTMVRADARTGVLDPALAEWAGGLLLQTRLLIDARRSGDPTLEELLQDLELVLIQIVGAAETGSMDEVRARLELELALRSLEDGEMLPRIQAVLPTGMAGT